MNDSEMAARLEERVIALDKKVDYHANQNASQHEEVSEKFSHLSGLVQTVLLKCEKISNLEKANGLNEKTVKGHGKELEKMKRDRTWIVGIFGLLWGAMLVYLEYRLLGHH